jgi:hypothetical protein
MQLGLNGNVIPELMSSSNYLQVTEWDLHIGCKDMDGNDLFEGDLVNVCYSNKDGYIFDGIYKVVFDSDGIKFEFVELLWESYAYNQYPLSSGIKPSLDYADNRNYLAVWYDYNGDPDVNRFNDEYCSRYFRKTGNIHDMEEM